MTKVSVYLSLKCQICSYVKLYKWYNYNLKNFVQLIKQFKLETNKNVTSRI